MSILSIVLSKLLFKKWLNHLSLYCMIWGPIIFLYESKLLPYPDVIPLAWFFIISAFLSFLLGILTITSARNLNYRDQILSKPTNISLAIFADGGRTLKYSIIFFSIICLLAAIQNWVVLINIFGSIPAVFLNAVTIYKTTTTGGLKGVIPYISQVGYVSVFLTGIYAAYKGKFSFLTFFPFIGITLKDLAIFGRGGTLLALMEFMFSFVLFRHLLSNNSSKRFKFSKGNAIVATTILLVFLIISVSIVKISRSSGVAYAGASRELRLLKDNLIISPSIYLYFSSPIGVLSQYLNSEGENPPLGQNTFLPFYAFLAKFDVIEKPPHYQKGYYVPMWTNTGTFIRELHADFGVAGVFLGPFIIGLIITWLWFKFYEKKSLIVFTFLVHLYLIIGFSFLVVISREAYWLISLVLLLVCLPVLEKLAVSSFKKSSRKTFNNTDLE